LHQIVRFCDDKAAQRTRAPLTSSKPKVEIQRTPS
jgi:hypothetical protein